MVARGQIRCSMWSATPINSPSTSCAKIILRHGTEHIRRSVCLIRPRWYSTGPQARHCHLRQPQREENTCAGSSLLCKRIRNNSCSTSRAAAILVRELRRPSKELRSNVGIHLDDGALFFFPTMHEGQKVYSTALVLEAMVACTFRPAILRVRDNHEAQVQLGVEHGMAHCSCCLIPRCSTPLAACYWCG